MMEWSDQPLEDRELPDEADLDEDDDAPAEVSACRNCGELIYEQAEQCPYCKHWLGPRSAWGQRRNRWYVRAGLWLAAGVLLLLALSVLRML